MDCGADQDAFLMKMDCEPDRDGLRDKQEWTVGQTRTGCGLDTGGLWDEHGRTMGQTGTVLGSDKDGLWGQTSNVCRPDKEGMC